MEDKNTINLQTSSFQLGVQEHPLSPVVWHTVNTGISVAEIKSKAPNNGGAECSILVNGKQELDLYTIQPNDRVLVTLVPAGLDPVTQFLIILAATIAVTLLVQSFLPDAPENEGENSFNRITGLSNNTPLYEPFPLVLGRRKVAPIYISRPYTTYDLEHEYFHALFSAGYGPLKLENFRFGSVGIEEFEEGDIELVVLDHYENTDITPLRNFWPDDIFQESVNLQLEEENGFVLKSSAVGASSINSVIVLPQGGFKTDKKGRKSEIEVRVRQDIQVEDGTWWTRARGSVNGTRTRKGYLRTHNGIHYLWTTEGQTIQFNNPTWLANNSIIIPPSDYKQNGQFQYTYIRVDESVTVISALIPIAGSHFRRYNLITPRHEEFWPTDKTSEINTRTRLESPSAQEIEDQRINTIVMFDNIQTIRPLSDDAFEKAIGGDRTKRYIDGNGVAVFKPTIIGLKMRATGQLNGAVDNFYCDATMVVPEDKDVDWSDWTSLNLEPSTNPADAYKWVMQGPANFRPVPHAKINETALGEWRDRCNTLYEGEPQWTISANIDSQSSMLKVLSDIAYTGRASFHFDQGQFSVIEKIKKTVPKQVFTPRNTSNFQSKRVYPEITDGVKFTFDSAERDYEQDERFFEDPTKTEADKKGRYTSTSLWGVDNYNQAYRLLRLAYYEQLLRREVYSFSVDAEALVCSRGDLVYIQNDIINVGTSAGRITAIDGQVITLDETIDADTIVEGGIQIRNSNGGVVTTAADYLGDGKWDCTDIGANTQVGDLVVYGELGHESLPCIVSSINYDDNMVAGITAVNAANEVFDFDEDDVPTYNSNISLPLRTEQPNPPVIDVNAYAGVVYLYIVPQAGINELNHKVYVQTRIIPDGVGADELDSSEGWSYALQEEGLTSSYQLNNLTRGSTYQVRVQYRTDSNKASLWSNYKEVTLPLGNDLTAVTDLNYLHKLDATYLVYNPAVFTEFDRYEIRTDDNFGTVDSDYVGSTKDTSFNIGLITSDDTYYIAARNIYGAYSESTNVLVENVVPVNPTGLTAVAEGFTIRLSWTQVTTTYSIANYEVRYTEADVGDVFGSSIELGTFDALSITHTTSTTGIYNYYVRTRDIAGQVSDWVNTNVEVIVTAGTIADKLDNIETVIDDINIDNDNLKVRVFNLSNSIEQSELEILRSFTEQAASREDLRYRIQNNENLIDAAVYIDPLTGTIINRAFAYTDESFSEAQILIDGVDAKVELNVQEIGLLEDEVSDINAELVLIPGQITSTATTIISEAIAALEPAHTFNFYDSAQGWVAVNGTLSTATPNEISVTEGDIENDSLDFDAGDNPLIRMAITRTAGSGWVGDVIIERDNATTETFSGIIEEVGTIGTPVIRSIDFRGITAWNGTVERVRLILGDTGADEFDITQIVIGKPDAYTQELDDLTSRVTIAEIDISSNKGAIELVVSDLQTFSDDTDDKFVEVGTTIDALDGKVTTSLTAISGNRQDFENAELDRLFEEIDSSNYRVADIDTKLNIASAINSLQVDVSDEGALAKSIVGLQALTVDQGNAIEANTAFIQEVETNVDGNASAITTIASGVTGESDEATALVKLESYLSDGGLAARAFFGVENNNRVTGIVANDDGVNRQIEFKAESFVFLDEDDNVKVSFAAGEYIFDGLVYARGGSFEGSISVGSQIGSETVEDLQGRTTTAQNSADNVQSNLTTLTNNLGDVAYEDLIELSKLGTTVVDGGYIKTDLLDVDTILGVDATFSGTVTGATINGTTINSTTINGGSINGTTGTFSGTVYAENIDGDVVDSIVKTTTTLTWDGTGDPPSRIEPITTFTIDAQPFDRYVTCGPIMYNKIGTQGPICRFTGVVTGETITTWYTSSPNQRYNVVLQTPIVLVPAGVSGLIEIRVGEWTPFDQYFQCPSQDIVISAFKAGSTLH